MRADALVSMSPVRRGSEPSRPARSLPLRPPRVEPPQNLLLRKKSFVESNLQQEVEGRADISARRDVEVFHHCDAVELRTYGVQFLALAKLDEASLELVDA